MKRVLASTFRLWCAAGLLLMSAAARADVVLDWNAIAVNTAIANKQTPWAQARSVAIVQLAVFEAVNAIDGKYRPYLGTVTAVRGASAEAAAIEAAYKVLSTYFSASQAALDADWASSMAVIEDGPAKVNGIQAGDDAANAMIALRLADGSAPAQFKTPGPVVAGEWQATPSCPIVNGVASGVALQWQFVTPFGIDKASDFLLRPPPALTSEKWAKALNEVMTVGGVGSLDRPQDRTNVAVYYAASSPSQVFNQAARQVSVEQGRSLEENARDLALLNMAMSDSLVASFYNKYHYNFWRPETAIHASGDTSWAPLIVTPCFPSYPSNHGSASNGAAEVMRHLYGEGGHTITLSNPAAPGIILQYSSFKEITDDISDARVYGGIHYRTDQDAGATLGQAVGQAVYRHNLRPVDE